MLKAVTNRDYPMLRQALGKLLDIELECDPSIKIDGRLAVMKIAREQLFSDPKGRIRIFFVDTGDLAYGMARGVEVTGFNIPHKKLMFISVPKAVEAVSDECGPAPKTIEGYLLAITLHELYELFTGDFCHCDNPRRCINSACSLYDVGTCSACLGGLIDEKLPDLKLKDVYCEYHLKKLRHALENWES